MLNMHDGISSFVGSDVQPADSQLGDMGKLAFRELQRQMVGHGGVLEQSGISPHIGVGAGRLYRLRC